MRYNGNITNPIKATPQRPWECPKKKTCLKARAIETAPRISPAHQMITYKVYKEQTSQQKIIHSQTINCKISSRAVVILIMYLKEIEAKPDA